MSDATPDRLPVALAPVDGLGAPRRWILASRRAAWRWTPVVGVPLVAGFALLPVRDHARNTKVALLLALVTVGISLLGGLAPGALDMMHCRALDGFTTRILGTNRYAETEGSSLCVIAAGQRRSAGMSRHDLLEANAKVVTDVTPQLVQRSPDAVLIVVTNPSTRCSPSVRRRLACLTDG
jgi:hypothetical protein